MRRVGCPIEAHLRDGRLSEIVWANKVYAVEHFTLLRIREGRWWLDPAELRGTSRTYYRVLAAQSGRRAVVLEIYRENGAYVLSGVVD